MNTPNPPCYISVEDAMKVVNDSITESYDRGAQAILSAFREVIKNDWKLQLLIRIAPIWTLENVIDKVLDKIDPK